MPLRPKQNLDNLTYILSKDATSGARAGFDVQRMRNRLTEIEYDINHIQGDIDDILTEDITALWNAINELRTWTTQELNDLRQWTQEELDKLKQWAEGEFSKVNEELTYIKTNYEHFETGTRMLFYQAAAPAGWSIVPGLEDATVRVVSVNGGSLGDGAAFPTVFAAQNVGNTTLTLNQIPAHSHSGSTGSAGSHSHSGSASSSGAHAHSLENTGGGNSGAFGMVVSGNYHAAFTGSFTLAGSTRGGYAVQIEYEQASAPNQGAPEVYLIQPGGLGDVSTIKAVSAGSHSHSVSVGSAGSHTHSVSVGNTGGGGAHTHSVDLTIKHICVIVCQKEIVF